MRLYTHKVRVQRTLDHSRLLKQNKKKKEKRKRKQLDVEWLKINYFKGLPLSCVSSRIQKIIHTSRYVPRVQGNNKNNQNIINQQIAL